MTRKHSTRLSQAHDEDPEDDGQHTAARDYPELGSVLDDRPDPGRQITVIGSKTAAAYGTDEDPRNSQYNGGEGDAGMYWAEPGQQQWTEQNSPQEEVPLPAYSPETFAGNVMARLHAMEEAAGLFGREARRDSWAELRAHMTEDHGTSDPYARHSNPYELERHHQWIHDQGYQDHGHDERDGWEEDAGGAHGFYASRRLATTINGTQVDDAGDAPEHGTVPRAGNPDSYDDQSHEGEGDDKWSQALPWGDKKNENAATVGMYPEGISSGGGPGISVGPFTALVPWTGEERGRLHRWQEEPTATWGDFVNSADFPLLDPGENVHRTHPAGQVPEPIQREAVSDRQWEMHLRKDHGWSDANIASVLRRGDRLSSMHEALHSGGLANHQHPGGAEQVRDEAREHSLRNMFGRDITENGPRMSAPEGYPLAAPERGGASGEDPMLGIIRSKEAAPPVHPDYWEQKNPAVFRRMMSALNVHVRIDGKELPAHEHDDEANSLDSGKDKTLDSKPGKNEPEIVSPQLDNPDSLDSPADISPAAKPAGRSGNPAADSLGFPQDHPANDPGTWPQAGADVSERERAYTQGKDDGKVRRGMPAPSSFSPDDGDSGGGGDQDASTGEEGDQPDDESTPFSKDAALGMFAAAAGSRAFRFEFTAAWHDVVAKAKRIRAEGHVRIVHASPGMVIGEVRGDHDTYESGIQRPVGKRQTIQHWACGCPWASFHQDKAYAGRYAGRPCSHVMALQFEAQARGMFGRSFSADSGPAGWTPPTVVVKSMPPYEGDPHAGQWREQWRAPVARQGALVRMAETFCPSCAGDRDDSGRCMDCGLISHGAYRRTGTPDEARDQDWTPEERDERERATGTPAHYATAVLARAGADPDEIGALRLLAGLRATADQANSSWGSQNVSDHPPQKPYGATSPPDKDQDPGSYGPLAAPDPENWGGIQDDSAYQMPLTNSAALHQVLVPGAPRPAPGDLHWPDMNGWQAEDQGTFGFTDHAPTAGPSTAMNPHDPNGIRMEEALASGTPYPFRDTVPQLDGALAELHGRPEPALPSTTGDDEIEATAATDGTIGGGDAGTGQGQGAPEDTAALSEFGAARRMYLHHLAGTPMGDLGRETWPQAQQPSPAGQEPGMGSMDDALSPDDPSIQTTGNQQWSGGGADSDETAVPAGEPQGDMSDIVAAFQRSAASKAYEGGAAPGHADGDIAAAARQYLSKTADALPQAEADELIREGRGDRARNLGLLRLEGTHYEDEEEELNRKGVSLDDHDDDVIFA